MKAEFLFEEGSAEYQNICRCLTNLLNIPAGSIPLSRGLGLSWSGLSRIPPELENDIATEIVEKVEEYEPRVSVSNVSFIYEDDGMVTVRIELEKGDEDS